MSIKVKFVKDDDDYGNANDKHIIITRTATRHRLDSPGIEEH
jgi:hypothetical protein